MHIRLDLPGAIKLYHGRFMLVTAVPVMLLKLLGYQHLLKTRGQVLLPAGNLARWSLAANTAGGE